MQPAENDSDLLAPGTILAGKYELLRVIGEGGMGIVYEATHLRLNQRVAIKMLRPTVQHLDSITPRFDREARTAAHLRGRHVARIFDVDVTERGLPFMVMEYLEGRDLAAELAERGPLSVEEATGYVLQACVAMQEAHSAGIVHRDLKPANLFLTEEAGERIVKVLDFGISKITHEVDSHLTGTFATVGTPLHMSPEQVRSSKDVDARTDIWSLAVILYEALAGQPPFFGSMTATAAAIVADPTPSLCAKRSDVPVELEAAIERALTKSPAQRYPDVESLTAALAPFGPPRLPVSSRGDNSNPLLPPSSGPIPSVRLVPPAPVSRPRIAPAAFAETMLLPRSEERRAVGRRRMQLAGLSILGATLFSVAATFLYRSLDATVTASPPHSSAIHANVSEAPARASSAAPPGEPGTQSATASAPSTPSAPSSSLSVRSSPSPSYGGSPPAARPTSPNTRSLTSPSTSQRAQPTPPPRPPANPTYL